jgi:hypothetical protein
VAREHWALRLIAIAFVSLAIYIAVQSAITLLARSHPGHSPVGIMWLAATRGGRATTGSGLEALREDGVVDGCDHRLAGVDSLSGENRHQRLAELVELLL